MDQTSLDFKFYQHKDIAKIPKNTFCWTASGTLGIIYLDLAGITICENDRVYNYQINIIDNDLNLKKNNIVLRELLNYRTNVLNTKN